MKSGSRLVELIWVEIILLIWPNYFCQTGPNSIKKGLFKAALSKELTNRLIGREEPGDYASYYTGVRRVADDL
jgi:hypothetical protein